MDDRCTLPPAGWTCTRAPGHDGPCAAIAPGGAASVELREALQGFVDDLTNNGQNRGSCLSIDHDGLNGRIANARRVLSQTKDPAALATSSPVDAEKVRLREALGQIDRIANELSGSDAERHAALAECGKIARLVTSSDENGSMREIIDRTLAAMIAVATAEEDSELADEWPLDCRAQVDGWQAALQPALGYPHGFAPSHIGNGREGGASDVRDRGDVQ